MNLIKNDGGSYRLTDISAVELAKIQLALITSGLPALKLAVRPNWIYGEPSVTSAAIDSVPLPALRPRSRYSPADCAAQGHRPEDHCDASDVYLP
jgi:hypothetical protein